MRVKICSEAFDPWQELQDFQNANNTLTGKFGATSIFIGTMRDFNEGDEVTSMTLEHYPGMTERQLEKISIEASEKWQLVNTLVVHRVGKISPNEPIVVVGVWSSHRDEAFEACRYIMEALKSTAPFWKKELLKNTSERWVSQNLEAIKHPT